jgi:MHS family alpha-ketoglutarate permease-like MFS transporter
VKAEMFPVEVRALGVSLAYAVANAVFGGSAEYVALGLKTIGHESAFYWYVTVMLVICFLVSLRLPRIGTYLQSTQEADSASETKVAAHEHAQPFDRRADVNG